MQTLFEDIVAGAPESDVMLDTFAKMSRHLLTHKRVLVSISGGSDSDILIDLVEFCKTPYNEITYVFFDTRMEYAATHKHLDYLRERYDIEITERPARKSVPVACKQYGIPFLSKKISNNIHRLQRHNFQWEDGTLEELLVKYPRCKSALRWWCNEWGERSLLNISNRVGLKEFMMANHPDIPISDQCCNYAKKYVAQDAMDEFDADLDITGVRSSEGGIRRLAYDNCFSGATMDKRAQYRPLFFWKNKDKEEYNRNYDICNSECYSVYGLTRTGCACCPFGRDFEFELEAAKRYEPNLYKAATSVFEKSYEYTRAYFEYRATHTAG